MNTLNTIWGLLWDFFRFPNINCTFETAGLVKDLEIFNVIVGGCNCV